jgi:SprB repeat
MMKYLLLPFCLTLCLALSAQKRYYVQPTAQGTATGLSWTDAFPHVQVALDSAKAGDTVWVAAGTYKPTTGNMRTVSFEPRSGVRLYGGFSGSETQLNQRNWNSNPTILSGDIGAQGDSLDNSYNVIYMQLPDSNTVLDGFVVRGGNANFTGTTETRDRRKCGGGIYINGKDWEAYPTIAHCTILLNTARNSGGGVFVNGSGMGSVAPLFQHCRFERNRTLGSGGGLARTGGSWIERGIDLEACVFENNRADQFGGGFYYTDTERGDELDMVRDTFRRNFSFLSGSAVYAIIERDGHQVLTVDSCKFDANLNSVNSQIHFNALQGKFLDSASITHNSFVNENYISTGQASFRFEVFGKPYSNLNFSNNFFSNINCSPLLQSEYVNADYLLFSKNKMYNNPRNDFNFTGYNTINYLFNITEAPPLSNSSLSLNVTSLLSHKTLIIQNSVFGGNSNSLGPVLYFSFNFDKLQFINSLFSSPLKDDIKPDTVLIINSILLNEPDPENLLASNNYTYIGNSYVNNLDCSQAATWGYNVVCNPDNITGTVPLFRDSAAGDYRLLPCSPLVNGGDNSYILPGDLDLLGQPRIQCTAVDIGPYESAALAIATEPAVQPACIGSANGSIVLNPINACVPYTYAWVGPSGQGTGLTGLQAGTYTLTLTDSKNETVVLNATIPGIPAPQVAVQSTPVFCGTTMGGTATPTVTGAVPPLLFDWSGGSTDSIATNLPSGPYAVTVTDTRGCMGVGTATIQRMGTLQLNIQPTPITCYNTTDGSISVQAANGAPPIHWLWNNGDTTSTLSGLGPGVYSGMLFDALGCAISWNIPLDAPDSLRSNATITNATGVNVPDGSVTINPTGGTGSIQAKWSNNQSGWSITGLLPGTYTVTLTDENACTRSEVFVVDWSVGTYAPTQVRVRTWPNPATQLLWVEHGAMPPHTQFRMMDVHGRSVLQVPVTNAGIFQVEIGQLPGGVYYWEVAGTVGCFLKM